MIRHIFLPFKLVNALFRVMPRILDSLHEIADAAVQDSAALKYQAMLSQAKERYDDRIFLSAKAEAEVCKRLIEVHEKAEEETSGRVGLPAAELAEVKSAYLVAHRRRYSHRKEYCPDGTLRMKLVYFDGLLHKGSEGYYDTGALRWTVAAKNDSAVYLSAFYEGKQLLGEAEITPAKIVQRVLYPDGRLCSVKAFHRNEGSGKARAYTRSRFGHFALNVVDGEVVMPGRIRWLFTGYFIFEYLLKKQETDPWRLSAAFDDALAEVMSHLNE